MQRGVMGFSDAPTAYQSHVPTILPLPCMGGSPPQCLFMPHPRLSFNFSCFSLSPVAKETKPNLAKDASVCLQILCGFTYASFHESHLLWLVPGISCPRHWSVTITDSDEQLLLTLCFSSLFLAGESLSLLCILPLGACIRCGALVR